MTRLIMLALLLSGCIRTHLVPVPAEADVRWQRQVTARLNALVDCQDIRIQQCIDAKEIEHAKPH